jgi:hypothetical protein
VRQVNGTKIIERARSESAFLALCGIAKEAFQQFGEGEEFLRRERENFYGPARGKNRSRKAGLR